MLSGFIIIAAEFHQILVSTLFFQKKYQ